MAMTAMSKCTITITSVVADVGTVSPNSCVISMSAASFIHWVVILSLAAENEAVKSD